MPSREKILNRIRHNLGRGPLSDEAAAAARARIEGHSRNIVPDRTNISAAEKVDLFQQKMEALGGTVTRVSSMDNVAEEVQDYLSSHNLPSKIKMSPALSDLSFEKAPLLEVTEGAADIKDDVSLTPALAAMAESGTLCMASGADTPSTLNFLPENHIVVLKANQVTGGFEDAWDRVRDKFGTGNMPRTVNFISGPSRTADIEQTLIMGAHGPRRLHVVIVEDEPQG
ncbi:MAG: lactate utilization protein [Proteobacteria bacterium]|nr:lactate utilization protein [Pseudomonadota bacterium]